MVVRKEQKEYTYWTDKVAEELQRRAKENKILQKVAKDRGYIVYDEKTPSGRIHIGSARGWIIHDIIAKSLRDRGLKGRFILSSDDMDPFDSLPVYIPKEKFEKFLGIPMRGVPSPEKGHDSYASYFFAQCTDLFDKWGIDAELESTADRYVKGDFNKTIKIALDNSGKIQEIYKKIYGKSLGSEKLPFNPICEKCGKIGTTVAYEWDADREVVKYICKPDMVSWAKGCGHSGEITPYNGNGKLPWKVEWAAKWPTVGVMAETAGKDHFTKGGSRTVAVAIACEIFKYPPPWPSTCEDEGRGYEFFLVEGKKMSTSKGLGASFAEISQLFPPQILRFLLVKTRPETALDFKEENMPAVYNDFERHERIYFGSEDADEREKVNAKRVYELSVIGKIPKKKPSRAPFEKLIEFTKIAPEEGRIGFIVKKLKESGYNAKTGQVKESMPYVENWINDFETEDKKQVVLNQKGKLLIQNIVDMLEKESSPDQIQTKLFEIIKSSGLQISEGFKLLYNIILNSDRGPRLGQYVVERGKEEIIRKLEDALKK